MLLDHKKLRQEFDIESEKWSGSYPCQQCTKRMHLYYAFGLTISGETFYFCSNSCADSWLGSRFPKPPEVKK